MILEKKIELLEHIPELIDIPLETKKWLIENCDIKHFELNDTAFKSGDPINEMRMVIEGKFQIRIQQKNGWREFGTFDKGTITGVLPFSRLKSATADAVAIQPSTVLTLHKKHFPILIQEHQELTEVLVHSMTTRVREFTNSQQQNEKLMALGKLSAGLAHELNNPAAAIVRSSQLLKRHLSAVPEKFKAVMEIEVTDRKVDLVNQLLFNKLSSSPQRLSLQKRTDLEDDIADFLEKKGYPSAFDDAEVFVDFGFSIADFEQLSSELKPKNLPSVIGWIAQVLATEKMVDEIEMASSRIADLVKSVKSYTHMDRSHDKESVDLIDGIEDTLNILSHKLKAKNVNQVIDVEEVLPKLTVFPSEMNQVWMNLIDNALDALPAQGGILKVELKKDNEYMNILITDNGEGIPEEIKQNIFDPFFTTKKVGEGTGLGLDVVKKIINKHNGTIKVESKPGNTIFTVCIPFNQ